jgi:hypothetical protein
MEVRVGDGKGPVVKNMAEVLQQVQQELQRQQRQWAEELRKNPGGFADLEAKVHQAFHGLADRTVAGLLAEVTAQADFAQDQKKSS